MDQLRIQCFDAKTLTTILRKLSWCTGSYNIKAPHQVYNLDEKDFSPERNLLGKKRKRVIVSVRVKENFFESYFSICKPHIFYIVRERYTLIRRSRCSFQGESRTKSKRWNMSGEGVLFDA